MITLGLNAFHGDSAACILIDGQLRAAAEEERFRRIKHWAGFPSAAIGFCLAEVGLKLADVDVIAINTEPQAARWQKLGFVASGKASAALIREKLLVRKKRKSIDEYLRQEFPQDRCSARIEYVEHHLAHLASAYLVSPFAASSIVSVDGFGDFASAAWGFGDGEQIDLQRRIYFPHSLGVFYQAMTQFLGFPNYGDEYKVMGLAPYGEPRFAAQMDDVLRQSDDGSFALNLRYFRHHREPIGYEWDDNAPKVSSLFDASLGELFGSARAPGDKLEQHHFDIARSIQDAYERAFFNLLNQVYKRHGSENLSLAGGCGMNSVANGKIHLHTPFKQLYVQSAAGDAGGAIGAAVVAAQRHGIHGRTEMRHAYWGPTFSDQQHQRVIDDCQAELDANACVHQANLQSDELLDQVSAAIADGKVIGWFQGAMEWGPRALGNRSILCDPRRADMKDILNIKIKRRESFRPFAPSVLREHVDDWFESDGDVPFMMKVFQIKAEQRTRIPAVTHVDGSGRLQTVTTQSNPLYHGLISAFHRKTGVPMLLNTSFNENEPVVCTPAEAMACFLRTNMDVLVLGSHMISRVTE